VLINNRDRHQYQMLKAIAQFKATNKLTHETITKATDFVHKYGTYPQALEELTELVKDIENQIASVDLIYNAYESKIPNYRAKIDGQKLHISELVNLLRKKEEGFRNRLEEAIHNTNDELDRWEQHFLHMVSQVPNN